MPIAEAYKTVNIKPVSGPLDMRSEPDQVPFGGYRRRINWEITDSGKPGRTRGFRKLFGDVSPYNNQDLHDQLLSLQIYYDDLTVPDIRGPTVTTYPPPADICGTTLRTRTTGRQPVTMLDELVSADGRRKLIAGTQNRLYVMEESIGNWKIISDAYGGTPESISLPERRWKKPAQVGNVSVLTNGFDPLIYYQFDGVVAGCQMQSVQTIPDLALLGVTSARTVFSWRGVVFIGDVTMNGVRYEDMVMWSDKDAPLSFDPAAEGTVTDSQRLSYGERIMGFVPLHNYLLVITTRGIWQITISVDFGSTEASAFTFQNLYAEPETGEGCIAYPNTLCTDGESIYYLGRDGVFQFNLYMSSPQKTKWLHDASSLIFQGIEGLIEPLDESICESHIGWYDTRTLSIGFSWVADGDDFPERLLQCNTQFKFASELDYGVTSACSFTSSSSVTFRDWILSLCACTEEEIDEELPAVPKTGGYCVEPSAPSCTPLAANAPIYTNKPLDLGNGVIVEDYTQPEADEGSFCKQFGNLTINDLCKICKNDQIFVFAHAGDLCLKEFGPEVYYREISTAVTPCGTWVSQGYDSKITAGPMDAGMPDEDKNIRKLELEYQAVSQLVPSEINLRIGYAANAFDPNLTSTENCGVVWKTLSPRQLVCPPPNKPLAWNFSFTGRMLYFELTTSGTGGGHNISRIGMEIRALPRSTTS